MSLSEDELSTVINSGFKVDLQEGIGDSRIFRDLEYSFSLQHIKRGETILDIGSSQPWFLQELEKRDCKVVTIDIDSKYSKILKQKKLECVVADLTKLPFKDNSFSKILCISTLEHVHGDEDIEGIEELGRLSKNLILILPVQDKEENWSPHNFSKERKYSHDLLNSRLLKEWRILRRAHVSVWDPAFMGWLSEECLYLRRYRK